MKITVSNVKWHEDEPRYSAYDPYCKTAFGNISCTLRNEYGEECSYSSCTADGSADHFAINGKTIGDHYTKASEMRKEINLFNRWVKRNLSGGTYEFSDLMSEELSKVRW